MGIEMNFRRTLHFVLKRWIAFLKARETSRSCVLQAHYLQHVRLESNSCPAL